MGFKCELIYINSLDILLLFFLENKQENSFYFSAHICYSFKFGIDANNGKKSLSLVPSHIAIDLNYKGLKESRPSHLL